MVEKCRRQIGGGDVEHGRARGRKVEEEDKGRMGTRRTKEKGRNGGEREDKQIETREVRDKQGKIGKHVRVDAREGAGPTPSTSVDPRPRNPSGRVHEKVDPSKALVKVSLPSGEPPRRRIQEHPSQHHLGFVAGLPSLATRSIPRKDGNPLVCLVRILTAWIVQHT